jgi:hypothetical protein
MLNAGSLRKLEKPGHIHGVSEADERVRLKG